MVDRKGSFEQHMRFIGTSDPAQEEAKIVSGIGGLNGICAMQRLGQLKRQLRMRQAFGKTSSAHVL